MVDSYGLLNPLFKVLFSIILPIHGEAFYGENRSFIRVANGELTGATMSKFIAETGFQETKLSDLYQLHPCQLIVLLLS